MTTELTPTLETVATDIDVTDADGQTVVDFDVDLGTDHDSGHEVQSRVTVEDGTVVDGVVRFGEAPTYEEELVDVGFWTNVFANLVNSIVGSTSGFRARLSDFGRPVPHLCIAEMDVDTFCDVLAELVETLSNWYDLEAGDLVDEMVEVL